MYQRGYLYFIVVGVFLAYLALQSRAFLFSPLLRLDSPLMATLNVGQEFTLKGRADRLSQVKVNGEPIPLDLDGNFLQKILVQQGVVTLQITATSRFGKQTQQTVTIIGK